MSKEANLILTYLQNEESDFWSVKEKNGIIKCYWSGHYRFSIHCDDGDFYVSGEDLGLNMLYNIALVLGQNM